MNKLPCYIVRDLLPSYTDGLTDTKTNTDVQAHLETCADCAAALRAMRDTGAQTAQETAVRDVAYLKTLRRRTGRVVLCVLLAAALLLAVPAYRYLIRGHEDISAYYRVTDTGNTLEVYGSLPSSGMAVSSKYVTRDGDVATVHIRSALVGVHRSGEFRLTVSKDGLRRLVTSNDRVLWEDGTVIPYGAGQLYKACTPYVGSASAVNNYLEWLYLREQLASNVLVPARDVDALDYSYTLSLQTTEEPYGLTVHAEIGGKTAPTSLDRSDLLPRLGTAILAGIENLGYVTFDFGGDSFTWTMEDADALLGYSVKSCADSAVSFQQMLETLNLVQELG